MSAEVTGRGTGPGSGPSGSRGSDDWVERVRAATDIVELIGERVQLRRVGRNFMGRCPFHEEKTPSFSVNAERQFYHCFSCKVGGDAFKFVQEIEKVGFLEAVELLSRRAGIPVPERRAGERGKRALVLEALEAAATAYEQWLGDPEMGASARAYLERRGIARETQRTFRLGLAPAGWEALVGRLRGKFSDEVLLEARLAGRKEGGRSTFDWFRNRLMVPLIAPGGAVLGFGARAFGDEQPKYLNSSESTVYHKGQFLFGLEQARRAVKPEGEMVVVEGYFDAIAMHQAGITNTVATSGTALTSDHARALKRMVRGLALTYDGDAAGQQAMLRSLGVLLAEGLDVVVVDLPAGEDPDSLVRRAGVDGWSRVREGAYDAVEFVQRHVLRTSPGGDPRERALQVVVRMLVGVKDAIRHRLLVERASQVFGLAEGVIARAARQAAAGAPGAPEPVSAAVRAQRKTTFEAERQLLAALWRSPELIEQARALMDPEDFDDPAARDLAARWWASGVAAVNEDGDAAAMYRALASVADVGENSEEVLVGAIRRLTIRRLERAHRQLFLRLGSTTGEEQKHISREIRNIGRWQLELETARGAEALRLIGAIKDNADSQGT